MWRASTTLLDVVFRAENGGLVAVAVEGGPAPGGGSYTGFGSPTINEAGDMAFAAFAGTSRLVVLAKADGTSRRVATRGDLICVTGSFYLAGEVKKLFAKRVRQASA